MDKHFWNEILHYALLTGKVVIVTPYLITALNITDPTMIFLFYGINIYITDKILHKVLKL